MGKDLTAAGGSGVGPGGDPGGADDWYDPEDPLAFDPAEFGTAVAAEAAGHPNAMRYGPETGREIVRRMAAGESLRAICRTEGMPSTRNACRWARMRPTFRAAMHRARAAAGTPFRGRRPLWCVETAQAIYDRVCAGESLTQVCADPDMPSMSTLTNWRTEHPEFDEAMQEAYEIRAERLFEEGWEIARAVKPKGAYAAHVTLTHLRWWLGRVAPRRYGPTKAVEPPPAPEPQVKVVIRAFDVERDERGWQRVVEDVPDLETGEVTRVPLGPFKPPGTKLPD